MSNNKVEYQYDSGIIDKIKEPPFYKVILHNDDQTPMDFVVSVVQSVFFKTKTAANRLMIKIHNEGSATCGIYPFDIAESKAVRVINEARKNGHPLMTSIEPES